MCGCMADHAVRGRDRSITVRDMLEWARPASRLKTASTATGSKPALIGHGHVLSVPAIIRISVLFSAFLVEFQCFSCWL